MRCDEVRELLSLYIDNMLDEDETREVEEHLSACGDCEKEYNEIKEVLDLLGKTKLVPVPEAFRFRLRKALKEEKRNMIEAGINGCASDSLRSLLSVLPIQASLGQKGIKKASGKNRWRVITSVAAVFTVGVISFGLYHDILGVLPDQFAANDQTGTAQTESAYGTYSGKVGKADTAADSGASEESPQGLQPMSKASGASDSNSEEPLKAKVRASANGSATPQESAAEQEPAAAPAPDAVQGPATEEEAVNGTDAADQDVQNFSKIAPLPQETSRSLTSSGVERQATSEEYYNALLEEKLADFDYQILNSEYTEDGEWQFRVFIFHGKDGNTYNEEIMIIGKDGKIEALYSDEFMGL